MFSSLFTLFKSLNFFSFTVQCMRAVRQKAMLSQRFTKETQSRAKRLTREMQNYWKKFDRVEKQQKRQEEKEAEQQQKMDLQLLEAKRQQRKLNFLITQTELVSLVFIVHTTLFRHKMFCHDFEI